MPVDVAPDLVAKLAARTDDMVTELAKLVAAESPSDDPALLAACADRVAELGERLLGKAPEAVERSGLRHLVWRMGAGSAPAVLLVGHYDTVWPAGTVARWPFTVEADGKATGPGAFDMKGGIVQLFHALEVLARPEAPVTVVLTADEEVGSLTSRELIEELARDARAALVLEPGIEGAVKIARKGTSMYQMRVTGRPAHAGLEPEKGINATIEAAHQILAVLDLNRPHEGTTVVPTVMSAGTTTNTVPAQAVVHVDSRATSVEEQRRVDEAMKALKPVLEGASLRIDGGINRPPLPESAAEELFQRTCLVAGALGLEVPRGVAVGGGSDGNFTAGVGTPTLDGLGADGAGAHAEGEYVLVDQMPRRAALLAGLIADILDS